MRSKKDDNRSIARECTEAPPCGSRARVHLVDVPFAAALKVFTKWGAGTGEFVEAMGRTKAPLAKPHV